MTHEDKDLLLKDLCARLPYHCRVFYEYVDDLNNKTYGYSLTLNTWCIDEFNADKAVVKPYLRPMSSMTEEEENEWCGLNIDPLLEAVNERHTRIEDLMLRAKSQYKPLDWLNKHHFDYRGLIERGLAIEVTEENNPYEN